MLRKILAALQLLLAALPLLLAALAAPGLAHAQFPPTPLVKLAVNPLTGKVYTVNEAAGTVTAFDAAHGASTTIPVGRGPEFIAANPATNRVYVNNITDASLTVIDGATDTVIGTYVVGAEGPITVDPVSDIVYIVRLTGTGSDEVTFFDDATASTYTIATNSFQPDAMAVNPATHTIYVAHYSTGDVRVISGAFDPNNDFPASSSIGVFSHPFAIAANVATNKVYVITQDSRGPIAVIDGATNGASFPAVDPGHASGPQALVVNPVTNKAYAAFANEVIVIDGATNALTYVPIDGASSGAIALGIDYSTNRVYAVTSLGTLNVIDGDSDTLAATQTIASGAFNIAVNPLTHTVYYYDGSVLGSFHDTAGTAHAIPLATTIEPLPGDTATQSGSITIDASSAFSPTALPVRSVYFQLDSTGGPWVAAAGSGPYTASFSGLAPGAHTIYAFAADGQDAPLATGPQSAGLLGSVASYTFTVPSPKSAPSVSLASTSNPSMAGEQVTFQASVSGSNGAATGSIDFLDGTQALCTGVALDTGSASCATASLAVGSHSITAQYSGDSAYDPATSAALSQQVDDPASTDLALAISASADPASTGKDVVFTLTVDNRGPNSADGVTVDNPLPADAQFVWASPSCTASASAVSCALPSALAAGSTAAFQVVLRPGVSGTLDESASVSASRVDAQPGDNSASLPITVNASPAAQPVARYRLYNDGTKEHLFTTDANEYATLGAQGWTQEGTAGHVLDNPGSFNGVTAVPYYRLYNDQTHWHHWTTDPNEYYTLVQFGSWHGEGVDGYILPTATTGATQLYRLLYPPIAGLHHWTVDANEYDTLVSQYGWQGEGGAGYVIE